MSFKATLDGDLKSYILPYTSIKHRLAHEKIRIGQIVHVIARHKGLLAAVDTKITRIERYLKEPGRTQITFGNPLPLQSDYIQRIERMADWRDRRRRKLDRGRGPATVTVASEETSAGYQYARFIVRAGQRINEVMPEILALLPPGGGQIVFMEGVYPFDGDIVIARDNVQVKGQGEGTRFVLAEDSSASYGFHAEERTGLGIADLSMDGQRDKQDEEAEHYGVTLENCREFIIKGVTVRDCQRSGIVLDDCAEGRVEGCVLNGNDYNLHVVGSSNLIVSGNSARCSRADGMQFESSASIVVSDNLCNETIFREFDYVNGIQMVNCQDVTISDNILNKNSGHGVWLDSACKDIMVSGNQCNSNMFNGILAGDNDGYARRITISGNTCSSNEYVGVSAIQCRNCAIINNIAIDGDRGGYLLRCINCTVSNNDFQNNSSEALTLASCTNIETLGGNRT